MNKLYDSEQKRHEYIFITMCFIVNDYVSENNYQDDLIIYLDNNLLNQLNHRRI